MARNYHCRYGEIDIIAQKGNILSFVEVKARQSNTYLPARDAVTPRKQEKIRHSAAEYLLEHSSLLQPRFDVCEVYFTEGKRAFVRLIEDAFR